MLLRSLLTQTLYLESLTLIRLHPTEVLVDSLAQLTQTLILTLLTAHFVDSPKCLLIRSRSDADVDSLALTDALKVDSLALTEVMLFARATFGR